MDKEYFIIVNDERFGPLSMRQLADRGIEPSTLVWTAGMPDWARADTVPDLQPILAQRVINEQESAFGRYANQQQHQFQHQYQQQYRQQFHQPTQDPSQFQNQQPSINWKTLAIIATVVGFIFSCIGGIVGVFAILQANNAEKAQRMGDGYTAQSAWSTCKTLCIVSFVLSGIGLIINLVYAQNMMQIIAAGGGS